MKRILVTGGAGFIGSNLVKFLIDEKKYHVCVVDKLTYAGSLKSLDAIINKNRLVFYKVDIADEKKIIEVFQKYKPDSIFHLAAESHVDRSINNSKNFIKTNIIGTYTLLEVSLNYWKNLNKKNINKFKFIHVSTDEVYGSLSLKQKLFSEKNKYYPNSPYSASKASSDHLVRAWYKTYELPCIITNCGNNYGPYQHPEKFIPVIIKNAFQKKTIPIYGNGFQVRDWIHVSDHVKALHKILLKGSIGETYNIGANNEIKNLSLAKLICRYVKETNEETEFNYAKLLTSVTDRKAHDFRYAISSLKLRKQLKWFPEIELSEGLKNTVLWYKNNTLWLDQFNKNSIKKKLK